jgi:hypothetical protein
MNHFDLNPDKLPFFMEAELAEVSMWLVKCSITMAISLLQTNQFYQPTSRAFVFLRRSKPAQ